MERESNDAPVLRRGRRSFRFWLSALSLLLVAVLTPPLPNGESLRLSYVDPTPLFDPGLFDPDLIDPTLGFDPTPYIEGDQIQRPLTAGEWRDQASSGAPTERLVFEANGGKAEPGLDFVARATGYVVTIADNRVEIGLEGGNTPIAMNLVNAATRAPSAASRESAVVFDDLYAGVDMIYSANKAELEYSFVVEPGGDPSDITLGFDGAAVSVTGRGDLLLDSTSGPNLLSTAPFTYQNVDGERVVVASAYDIRPDGTVGFTVGDFDPTRPLVIDPTFVAVNSAVGLIPDGGTLDVPVPAGVTAGDVLIAQVGYSASAGSTITPTAGWTVIDVEENPSHDIIQGLYWRVATASEPAQYGFTLSSGLAETATGAIAAYSDVDTTNPIDAFAAQSNGTSTSLVAPSITTTQANTTLLAFFTNRSNAFIDSPAGMTERWDIGTTAGLGDPAETAAEGADETLGAAGPTGTRTATTTASDGSVGHLVALAPAVCVDSDGDGLCDSQEDANTDLDNNPATNPGPDTDGDTTPNYLDADDDGDGTPTASENPDPNGDGDPRDALDVDRDGQPDYLDAPTTASTGTIDSEQKISDTAGGFGGTFNDNEQFGRSVGSIGDIDGDGVVDVVVGAPNNDDGGVDRGAVYVLFMNTDGTVRAEQKISDTTGGLTASLTGNQFGYGAAGIGDVDGDGIGDIAVGSPNDADGGGGNGAVYVLFLNADGTVKAEQKISDTAGGLTASLSGDGLGWSVAGLGDVDGDGIGDLAAGGPFVAGGAAYVLFLNADGTVKAEQKIAASLGGLTAPIGPSGFFGFSVGGPGDIDGDGVADLAVGDIFDDDGGSDRGAVHILFLNTDGTVKAEQKISDTAGGLTSPLADNDHFGYSTAGVGDVDGDGELDLVVGSNGDDSGGTDRGAVFVLYLNGDGTVRAEDKISDSVGGLTAALDDSDFFGDAVAGLGDLDGDGAIDLVVAAPFDDDGGTDRGAIYILDLTPSLVGPQTYVVNSTGDTGDNNTVDVLCDTGGTNSQGATECTLRAAIESANGHIGPDSINFNMPVTELGHSSGVWTFALATALPDVMAEVAIDATTQPGYAAAPVMVLDGTGLGASVSGLRFDVLADDSSVQGLSIINFPDNGVISGADRLTLTDNYIGVLPDGITAPGNATEGIIIFDGTNVVIDDNLIGGHLNAAIVVSGTTTGTVITGNTIGTDLGETLDFGNGQALWSDTAGTIRFGGTSAADRNIVANSSWHGIQATNTGDVITILGNSFRDSGALAVDLLGGTEDGFGVTANDVGDGDAGPNSLLNYPVITAAAETGGTVTVDFDLDVPAGDYRVEFFTNPSGANASGHGEAEQFADAFVVASHPGGSASYSTTFAGADGEILTASTTVDLGGGSFGPTSEYSLAATVVGPCAVADSDGDGLSDCEEDANTDADNDPATNPGPDTDGDTVPNYLDADDDGDTVPTGSENADPNGDGDPRDALDADLDGQPDYLDAPTGASDGTVGDEQRIDATVGGLAANLIDSDYFGSGAVSIGDLDGDGVVDVVVGASGDDDGQVDAGAAYVLFLNADGTVKAEQKISDTQGGLSTTLDTGDSFGTSVASLGDLDGDGNNDIAVGASTDDDGVANSGAIYVLFLNADGTVKAEQKISNTAGGLATALGGADRFGSSVAGLGDLDGDGITDIGVGALFDDDGVANSGAIYVLFLNADGTVKAEQKISNSTGGLVASLAVESFGSALGGTGDIDGDGVGDVVVGAYTNDEGTTDGGAVYVLFLNTDGTVKAEQKINNVTGGLSASLAMSDWFGLGVSGLGDVDFDGTPDIAVGAIGDDDGTAGAGAVYVLFLNSDGTVKAEQKISSAQGDLSEALESGGQFGATVSGLGDLDGDGTIGLIVGARYRNGGGSNRGAVYVLNLAPVNGVAQANPDTVPAARDRSTEIALVDNDVDANIDPISVIDVTDPTSGSAVVTNGTTVTYTPNPAYVGADSFDYWAMDVGTGLTHYWGLAGDGVDAVGTADATLSGATIVAGDFGDALSFDEVNDHVAVPDFVYGSDFSLSFEFKLDDNTGSLFQYVYSHGDINSVNSVNIFFLEAAHGTDPNVLRTVARDSDDTLDNTALQTDIASLVGDGLWHTYTLTSDSVGGLTVWLDGVAVANDPTRGTAGFDPVGVAYLGTRQDLDPDRRYGGDLDTVQVYGRALAATEVVDLEANTNRSTVSLTVAPCSDTDGDGLCDSDEDANTDADADPSTNPGPNTDGDANPNYLDADDDGDGTPTVSENADPNGDGDPRDALDSDHDSQPDYLDAPTTSFVAPIVLEQKISSTQGGLTGPLDNTDYFGNAARAIGDLDGDGVNDLAVGAYFDDDGGPERGAVHILFLNADGSVKAEQKISSTQGGLTGPIDDSDQFGSSVTGLGDLDGDGMADIAVGAVGDDDGSADRGTVYVLFLNADGTVKAEQKISSTQGGLTGPLTDIGRFGRSATTIGDLDNDGINDIAVGADGNDDGGTGRGAVYVLFLNGDGTVKAEQRISSTIGGLVGPIDDNDHLGRSVASLGDVDGDGVEDLAIGAYGDDDGGTERGAFYVLFLNTDGTVKAEQKVSDTTGAFVAPLVDGDRFGFAVAGLGDTNADGVPDLAVSAYRDDDGGINRGAVYIVTLNADGTAESDTKISSTDGGLTGPLDNEDWFGFSVGNVGDLNGDGTPSLAVGALRDDDGGSDRGAVYVFDLTSSIDSDGDGLWDHEEDANVDADNDPSTSPGPNTDGDANPNYLDADDDGDGTPTASESADPNGDGDPRDALDSDLDGQSDYLDAPTVAAEAVLASEQKISATQGGLVGPLDDSDRFGRSVSPIGDVDGDGVNDIVVGAYLDDDGGTDRGSVYVLFLNADGTVKAEQKISSTQGGLTGPLDNSDHFGNGSAGIGDIDGDGIPDIAVGAVDDDDGGSNRGATYVLFLNADGTVKAEQKISDTAGGLTAALEDSDSFGAAVTGLSDLDGDGINDIAVGAYGDDDGGTDQGAAYVLFLNADGTVKAEQKISSATGGLTGPLTDSDYFGDPLSGLGDIDGDGIMDLAVAAFADDDGGAGRGAVYVLFLNTDGTVRAEQKISSTTGGLTGPLADSDGFGSIDGVGDIDADGTPDVLVGAYRDDDGGVDRGAAYLLFLNADGTVKAEQKISSTQGGLNGPLDDSDRFGVWVTGLGDLDNDGTINLAVGAYLDDDGGGDRGAVYILDLAPLVDSDGDGLWDHEEDANVDADNDPSTSPGPNTDGDANPNYLDADDDGDGTATASESADPNGDGDPRDAIDSDHDGEPDYLDVPTDPVFGRIATEVKITNGQGGLLATLDNDDTFGYSVVSLGDVDRDGVVDLAVGAIWDDDGGTNRGAAYILFLNADGTVRAEQKISDTVGGFAAVLVDNDAFGSTVAAIGDVDGDGIADVAVGARGDDDGGTDRGAVYILFLNADGSVRAEQKISDLSGGLVSSLTSSGWFGERAGGIGDLDGDGVPDMVVGARRSDRVFVLFLNADGTVKAEQEISNGTGGLVATVTADDFGSAVSMIGDLDNDGVSDLAIGAYGDDDGGGNNGAVYILFMNANGTVRAEQKISSTTGGAPDIGVSARFGGSVASLGDAYGDGSTVLAVGAIDDDGPGAGTLRGAAYLLRVDTSGTVTASVRIDETNGGFTGPLGDYYQFGSDITSLGDFDGDGTPGLAISAYGDDDGTGFYQGAVYVLDLFAAIDSDGDGLWDHEEDANTDADFDAATNPGPDPDGDTLPNYLDADDDGDLIPSASENADPNGDGDPRDALDLDRDGEPDYLDEPTVPTDLVLATQQKISAIEGGLVGPLDASDQFGTSATSLGDIDGDGVVDMAVGAHLDDDGGPARGAVYVLFLNADGTVKAEQKISETEGGLVANLVDVDYFGGAIAGLGDLDGDGIGDLAVGAYQDDDGGSKRGAVYILFLNADGTVKAEQKISDLEGGLAAVLDDDDKFGSGLGSLGDVDGDGLPDLAVGADGDDDGASNQGAVHVLFLRADGTVKAEQKISATDGGFTGPLDSNDHFGAAVTGLGDLDGDGTPDLAIGAYFDSDGGSTRGAVYVLALNADGTIKAEQKISSTQGGLTAPLADTDWFGVTVSGLGDVDGDGTPDLAVGAYLADDGGSNRGRVHLLLLNSDGTVADDAVLSSTSVPPVAGLGDNDHFGSAVAGLGDLDGDGTIGLAVGARSDDDGGSARGAVYIFDLERYLLPLQVNSTGDVGDLTPGDGLCDTGGTNAIALDECTLRAAIEEANAAGNGSISFDLPFADTGQVGGVWTITPATPLDDIAVPVVLDGSTHPSWVATPVIEIDGTSMGASDGLHLAATADGSTIRSLAIGNVPWNVIDSRADNTVIVGNHLGVDAAGTTQVPLGSAAVVYIEGSANLVGGSTASDRNLIAGGDNGVVVSGGAADTTISGNYIGTDITGNVDFGQSIDGIRIENGVVRTTVGGPTPAHGNVIASAGQDAVEVNGESADGVTIQNNVMGIGADGTTQLRLGRNGIYIAGGADDIDVIDNVIGNTNDGIDIGGATTNTRIQGNTIGTNTGKTFNHDVSLAAIRVTDGATGIEIGGISVGEGNHLAIGQFGSSSIEIESALTDDVSILGNTITNLFGAIDLGADGPTANDPLDADAGPNDLKNYPTLAIANTTGAGPYTVDLDVSLDSTAGNYRIEVFANSTPGYGGAGRAGQLVHAFTIAHTGSGVESFATSYTDTSFSLLSATATEDFGGGLFGSTSEMSPPGAIAPVFVVNSTGDTADSDESTIACNTGGLNSAGDTECTLRAALQQANLASTPTIEFNIPVSDPGYDADGYWTISKTLLYPDLFSNGITIDGSTQPGFDSSRPIVVIDSNLAGGDLFDIVGDDVTLRSLALLEPGDDAVQVQGDRALLDSLWLGVDPTGRVIESPSTAREGIIVYGDSADLVVTNSRIAGFDSGILSNSGTVDATITGTEIFENRNGGIVFDDNGRITSMGNSIHDNVGLGIELGSIDGVPLPNDVGDGDAGPNDLLNYPVLTGTTVGAGTVEVAYTIDVPAGTYRVEFFDSDRPDPTGFGEGQTFLSAESIVHPGGSVAYSATITAAEGDVITATATPDLGGGIFGGTSEFSNAAQVGVVFVNSTGDTGDLATGDGVCDTGALNADGFTECTLRAAMEEANASAGVDIIHFQLAESDPGFVAGSLGYWRISPATALPFATDIVEMDASTQPGSSGTPLIELSGSAATAPGSDGLFAATGMTIRGVSITSWVDDAIVIGTDNVSVEASWLGVRPDETVAANGGSEVLVYGTTTNLTLGGPAAGDGNAFASGGANDGIVLSNTVSNVLIENNRFGVAADGVTGLGGVAAEHLTINDDVSTVTIRGNQFGGSPQAAVVIFGNPTEIDIVGNTFGTDLTGTVDLGGASAVYAATTGSVRFGGADEGDGNLVRNSTFDSIVVSASHTGTATLLGNSIAGSGSLAFDIANDGPDTNDPGDTVPGPNGTLNYPEIIEVVGSGGFVTVRFGLDVAAGDYRIEAFANPSGADPTGYGEGELFVGAVTVTHTGGGTQVFELDVASPAGAPISLTATVDLGGGTFGPTSEFSSVATPVSAAVVEDISPRLTDLTAAGGLSPAVSAVGIGGNGINIDGGAERLVGPATDMASSELTMSAWVNLDAAGNDPRIISKGVGAGAVYELLIDDATGEAVARIDVGGALTEVRGGSVPTGSWHQVVATWNGSVLTLYVDGVSVDTAAASGTLTVDLDEPLVVGNNRNGTAGLNGTLDQVELRHSSMPAAEILARFRNGSNPIASVTIGGEQTAAPAPWTTSGFQSRTGGNALAAPPTTLGADAWITAIGLDEPGVEMTAWWWISDPSASEVSAGTRTGPNPTDQFDAAASTTGLDLGVIDGAVRTSAATDATTLASGTWQQVLMSTDELGVTSFRLDGVTRLGPTSLTGLAAGSVGFRATDIDPGQQWFIDDVRLRRLVSDEPTTSLGPIERN